VVRHTLRRLLARGEVVAGVLDEGPWFDLGTLDRYAEVNFALATGALAWPGVAPSADGIVAPAGVDRTRLRPPVVMGEGARLAPSARLARAIVWDGAEAEGALRDAVVTRRAVVPLPAA
jgi:NDP-sugar pyrophosphorylase family protein